MRMLQKYSSLKSITGNHRGGICTIKLIPKEWLANNWEIDFATGNIITIPLEPGKDFILLKLIESSYKYLENPKSNRSGSYYELSLTGTSNDIDSATLQTLNTYRYHEWVVLFKDKKGRQRIAGNFTTGMQFEFNNAQENDNGGKQKADVKFTIQQEHPASFFGSIAVEVIPKLPAPFPLTITNPTKPTFLLSWPDMNYPAGTVLYLMESREPRGRGSSRFITISPTDFANFYKTITVGITGNFTYSMYAMCTGYIRSNTVSIIGNNVRASTNYLINDNLWLDLNAAIGVSTTTVGADSEVNSWTDQTTGKIFTFLGAKPVQKTDATVTGGKVITNSNNSAAALRCLTNLLPDNIGGMTIYIVASQAATNDFNGAFIRVGNNINIVRNGNELQLIAKIRNYDRPIFYIETPIVNNTFYTLRLQFDGTNGSIAVNNSEATLNTVVPIPSSMWTPAAIDLFKPGTGGSNKAIARILIYTKSHTVAEIIAVENYLKTEYAHY